MNPLSLNAHPPAHSSPPHTHTTHTRTTTTSIPGDGIRHAPMGAHNLLWVWTTWRPKTNPLMPNLPNSPPCSRVSTRGCYSAPRGSREPRSPRRRHLGYQVRGGTEEREFNTLPLHALNILTHKHTNTHTHTHQTPLSQARPHLPKPMPGLLPPAPPRRRRRRLRHPALAAACSRTSFLARQPLSSPSSKALPPSTNSTSML